MTNQDRPYSERDLEEVSENPEWTAQDIAAAKRIDELDPGLAANIRRALRAPQRPPPDCARPAPIRKPAR